MCVSRFCLLSFLFFCVGRSPPMSGDSTPPRGYGRLAEPRQGLCVPGGSCRVRGFAPGVGSAAGGDLGRRAPAERLRRLLPPGSPVPSEAVSRASAGGSLAVSAGRAVGAGAAVQRVQPSLPPPSLRCLLEKYSPADVRWGGPAGPRAPGSSRRLS